MNDGTYKISIRVTQATLRVDEIAKIIGRPANRAVNVGEAWTTPKGRVLARDGQPRIATETFCTFPGVDGKLQDFDASLAALADELSLRPDLPELARTGKVELFVGLIMDSDAGFELPPSLLQKLSGLGGSLGVCFYPPIQSEHHADAGDAPPTA